MGGGVIENIEVSYAGGKDMNFYDQMFNEKYVNPQNYYNMKAMVEKYNQEQNTEVTNAVKAIHDLCEAIKKMDMQHQQEAFGLCLAEMAKEFGW